MEALFKARWTRIFLVLMMLMMTAGAGSLILLLYRPNFFYSVDSLRLVLVSFAITGPIVLFNCFWTAVLYDQHHYPGINPDCKVDRANTEDAFRMGSLIGSVCSIMPLYGVIGTKLLFPTVDKGIAFWVLLAMQVTTMVMLNLLFRPRAQRQPNASQ